MDNVFLLSTWLHNKVPTTFPNVFGVNKEHLIHLPHDVPYLVAVRIVYGTYSGGMHLVCIGCEAHDLYKHPYIQLRKPLPTRRKLPNTGVYTHVVVLNDPIPLLDRLTHNYKTHHRPTELDGIDAATLIDCLLTPEEAAFTQLQIELGNK